MATETFFEICLVYRHRAQRLLVSSDTLRHPEDLHSVLRAVQALYGQRHACKVFRIEGDIRIPLTESSAWVQSEWTGLEESAVHPNTRFKHDITGVGRLLCQRYARIVATHRPSEAEKPSWMQYLDEQVQTMDEEHRNIWGLYILKRETGEKTAQALSMSRSTVTRYVKDIYTYIGQVAIDHWGWDRVWEMLQEPMPRPKKREKPRQN